jgi:hypothetical protein
MKLRRKEKVLHNGAKVRLVAGRILWLRLNVCEPTGVSMKIELFADAQTVAAG